MKFFGYVYANNEKTGKDVTNCIEQEAYKISKNQPNKEKIILGVI
jgi:hypothetical protein